MWIYRRLLHISRAKHISNEKGLRSERREKELGTFDKKIKNLAALGHNKHDILKLIIEGKRGFSRRPHLWPKKYTTGLVCTRQFCYIQHKIEICIPTNIVASLH